MRTRRGNTLPELLIAMVVMLLITGVVSAVYFAAMQVWRRCSSQSRADPPAHMAIARLARELKNAYQVSSMGTSSISFLLPQTDSDGVAVIPLSPASVVSYYLSDATGQQDRSGTVLWRKVVVVNTGMTRQQRIAENVQQLAFDYETTSADRVLAIYAVSITILGQERRQTYVSQFGSHVAFRNRQA